MALKVRKEWLSELVESDSRWKDIVDTVYLLRMVNVVPAKYAIISSGKTEPTDLVVYIDGLKGDHPAFRFANQIEEPIICVNRPREFKPMTVEEFENFLSKISGEGFSPDFHCWLMEIFDMMDHGETPQD